MNIRIQPKTDYSFLFSSLGAGAASTAGSNFLSQYASIKNGSYAKLMKAYYAEVKSEEVDSIVQENRPAKQADTKALAKVQTATDALKESADVFLEEGRDSLFALKDVAVKDENGVETTKKDYDKEAIYSAVSKFVESYNSALEAMKNSGSKNVENRADSMINSTKANSKMLEKLGITIESGNTLSLDKETFMKGNMSTVKSVFGENGSYGYRVSAQASLIHFTAEREASRQSNYDFLGRYNNPFGNGNLFSTYF